jgi:hypothetical protein
MEKRLCQEQVFLNDVNGFIRPGRPTTSKSDGNVEKVRHLVQNDRHLTVTMIEEELNSNRETAGLI